MWGVIYKTPKARNMPKYILAPYQTQQNNCLFSMQLFYFIFEKQINKIPQAEEKLPSETAGD